MKSIKRNGNLLLLRTSVSFFYEICSTSQKRTGSKNGVQYPRTSFKPRLQQQCSFLVYMMKKLAEPLAKVLANLGVTRGVAVCGADGLDEITLTGATKVYEIRNGEITSYSITPEQFGLKSCPLEELIGGTPEENAQITLDILTGKETGAKRDVVLMNAGMSLYLGIDGITLEDGIKKAKELIESGKAYEKYEEFKQATQKNGAGQ